MKFNYYPGCTLKTQAKDLDCFARLSAKALGVEMVEIEEWQCCGGVYPLGRDETAVKLASVRALEYAKRDGAPLLTLCSACHNVLKRVNYDMANDVDVCSKANLSLSFDTPYKGEAKVVHYLEMLRDYVGFDNVKKAVKNPVDKKIGAYYGCLLLRPSSVMALDNAENPTIMEDFISAIGATPVKFPFRNECCGAYVGVKNKDVPKMRSAEILKNARDCGVETIITACPLCLYNLQSVDGGVEVKYFTELLAEALGVKE